MIHDHSKFVDVYLPSLSADERHMMSMSNLETLVKFSIYPIARSISSLPKV